MAENNIKDYYGEEVLNTSGTGKDYYTEEITSNSPDGKSSLTPQAQKALVAASGAALFGTGLATSSATKKLSNLYNLPKVERNALLSQIKTIQEELGFKNTPAYSLPKLINVGMEELNQSLAEYENTASRTPINKLTTVIQKEYEPFFNNVYKAYGKGIGELEAIMSSGNVSFDMNSFKEQVIDPTINKHRELMGKPPFLEGIKNRKLSFSEAKEFYNLIEKDLPPSQQVRLKQFWGNFLEKNAPSEIPPKLAELNKDYNEVMKVKKTIDTFYNSDTGEFDKSGITRYFQKYLKGKYEGGTKELVDFLHKGNKLTKPMENIGTVFKELENVKTGMQEITDRIGSLKTKKLQADVLVEKLKTAQKRVDNRSIVNKFTKTIPFAGKLGNIFSRGLPTGLGVYGSIKDAYDYATDKEAFLYRHTTGKELAPKGTIERDIQLGRLI